MTPGISHRRRVVIRCASLKSRHSLKVSAPRRYPTIRFTKRLIGKNAPPKSTTTSDSTGREMQHLSTNLIQRVPSRSGSMVDAATSRPVGSVRPVLHSVESDRYPPPLTTSVPATSQPVLAVGGGSKWRNWSRIPEFRHPALFDARGES